MQTVGHAGVTDERGTKERKQPQDWEEQEDTPRQKESKKKWLTVQIESDTI